MAAVTTRFTRPIAGAGRSVGNGLEDMGKQLSFYGRVLYDYLA